MKEKQPDAAVISLLERTAQQGINAIGNDLQHNSGHQLCIVDQDGTECYPKDGQPLDEESHTVFHRIPVFQDDQYFYDKNHQCLILQASLSGESPRKLLLLFRKVKPEEIVGIIEKAQPAHLALVWYLKQRNSVQQQVEQELHRIYQGILIDNNIRLETLLTQQGIHLKPDQSYAVMLMHWPDEANIEMAALRAEMQKFAASHNLPTLIPLHWNHYTFTLISAFYHQAEYRGLMRDSSQEMTNRWQQAFRDRFHVPLSIGVGNAHPISDLHKSFHEARIALTFRTIKGHEGFVQWFRDLGIFGNLFSSPAEDIRAFCRQTLDKLLEYDHDYDTELQLTLRTLLDENFNYKLTAEKLFIHVNTVRYRAEKIAQLLNIDLNSPDVRFNLYAAIRIGDVLKKLDLMQPGYIGTIHTHNDKHHTKTSKTIF